MATKKIFVLDSVTFACKSLINHIRLFFFILLASTGVIALFVAIIGLLNKGFIQTIIYSPELQNYQQCIGANCLSIVYQAGSPILDLVMGNLFSLLISSLLLAIFFVGFDLGFKKIALDIYDHDTSKVKTLFSSFNLVPQGLAAWVLYCAMVWIGWFFFIITGFIALLRFAFFPYFIIDKNAGPIQALQMSYHATRNRIWDIFAFWMLIKIIVYVGSLSWIGIVITWPLSTLAYAYVYRHITTKSSATAHV